MTISVEVHPSSTSVSMYNEPDISSAYSLSGHVSISLSSRSSYFEKSRTIRVVLKSLLLTFEGQSELITAETGYSATRLCKLTRELAPAESIELTNDGHEDSREPCVWNFIFDIPVPGWLPGTAVFGNDQHGPAGTRYALFAEACFAVLDEAPSRLWSLASLCSTFTPKERVVRAQHKDIRVIRYTLPSNSSLDSSITFPDVAYVIDSQFEGVEKPSDSTHIPKDVLKSIEVLASVPECIVLDEGCVRLTVRLRASQLPQEQQRRLRLTEFEVKLCQREEYRKTPSNVYLCTFPLPSEHLQPERTPLLNPHPLKSLYDIGLLTPLPTYKDTDMTVDAFSLLPPKHRGPHPLPEKGVSFAQDARREGENAWCKLEVSIPYVDFEAGSDRDWERRHGKVKVLRPSEDGPLLSVHHELVVELTCTYDSEEEGEPPAAERLIFGLPLSFVNVPPTSVLRPASPLSRRSSESDVSCPNTPEEFSLPAYSQLYLPNGDRRIDYAIPLPAYSPRSSDGEEHVMATDVPYCEKL